MTSTARQTARRVRSGELRAESVARACLDRLQACRALNAACDVDADQTLAQARAVDDARNAGQPLGPLAGVPIAVKDNICTASHTTRCASRILGNFRAPFDATCVARLRLAGAVVAAKTNCDEFGMGWNSSHSAHGPVIHPRDPTRSPGGSSGGSAALVAAAAVPLALGSDTGGSVRLPAAWCGAVGLKPTYGRISRYGLVAFSSSLDHVGLIAGRVEDAALALSVCAGTDAHDATSADRPTPSSELAAHVEGMRIARVTDESFGAVDEIQPPVRHALDRAVGVLRDGGAMVESVALERTDAALAAYVVIACAEAASNLARYDGRRYGARAAPGTQDSLVRTRSALFGGEVKRRVLLGNFVLSADDAGQYLARARAERAAWIEQIDTLFERFDLLVWPTTPGLAPRTDTTAPTVHPWQAHRADLLTVPANLGGHPALSIPAPTDDARLFAGVQLTARRFEETTLLSAGAWLEAHGFHADAKAQA